MMKRYKAEHSSRCIRPLRLFATAIIAGIWLFGQGAPVALGKASSFPELAASDMSSQPLRSVSFTPAKNPHPSDPPVLFGVINDDEQHYDDEWKQGIRATVLELHWKYYEPQEGMYDESYIRAKQARLAELRAKGWYVQLIPGYQYVPDWVFDHYPDTYYVNQYSERYAPDPSSAAAFRVVNAPFNPRAMALIAGYLDRVFQDFPPENFDAVRIGGGVIGELRYPPPVWGGHTNCYWAFDASAQNPDVSGIPAGVAGWQPGIDPNPGTVGRGQLIVNPGFEQFDPFFGVVGWSPDDQVTTSLDSSAARSGGQALRLDIDTPHRIHQFVRVAPGTTYQVGAWLRSGGGGEARAFFTQLDADGRVVANVPVLKLSNTTDRWQVRSATVTTSPATGSFKVELDGNQPGTYFFDDLSLERQGETDHRARDIDVPMAFYQWYVQRLAEYQNWQIEQVRRHFDGQLDIIYAGKGIRANQVTDALTNDLRGDGWSENNSALYGATLYRWLVVSLNTTQSVALYLTGIEDPEEIMVDDASPYPCEWSAARWIGQLAQDRGIPIWAENSGQDTTEAMRLACQRLKGNGFSGLMWAFGSQLYDSSGTYASIDDYQRLIKTYPHKFHVSIPTVMKGE
jgi:hypothetical protein